MREISFTLALLCSSFFASVARADSYMAAFTCSGTCASTPSSSMANFAAAGPSSMGNFSWDGLSWTFTFPDYPREWLPSDFYAWSGFNDFTSGSNQTFFTFRIENLTVANDTSLDLLCPAQQACGPTFDWGVLTFSPIATPEPGTLGMIALGIALVLVMRNRLSALVSR